MLDALETAFPIAASAEVDDFSHPIYDPVDPFAENDTDPASSADWQVKLTWGDVVLFVFPIRLPGDGEKPKTRPCLVLDVVERGGHRFALLAYGTSTSTMANRGYEVVVGTADEVRIAGLDRYTRFVGARRLLVSVDHADFRPAESGGSPVIGRLGPIAGERLHEVRARIIAEQDIAADRRTEARRERQGRRARMSFPVTRIAPVEHRQRLPRVLPGASDRPTSPPGGGVGRRTGTLSLVQSSQGDAQ